MQFKKLVFTLSIGLLSCLQCVAAGKASHVVVMVWDGMRADFVSPETTPTLAALASNGVTFLHHHPVYPSLTEANTVAISTGVYPRQSGLLANNEYRPALNPLAYVETDDLSTVRKGDEVTGDHYLEFPTIAEILHTHGLPTIVAGTKPVALLHDRAARPPDALGIERLCRTRLAGGLRVEPAARAGQISAHPRQQNPPRPLDDAGFDGRVVGQGRFAVFLALDGGAGLHAASHRPGLAGFPRGHQKFGQQFAPRARCAGKAASARFDRHHCCFGPWFFDDFAEY